MEEVVDTAWTIPSPGLSLGCFGSGSLQIDESVSLVFLLIFLVFVPSLSWQTIGGDSR